MGRSLGWEDFKWMAIAGWDIGAIALGNLERYEEAIASYDKALEIKPDMRPPGTTKLAATACTISLS
ncbi:MAG: tetratricopeptide repeat protein [Cyanophyceae cyanobacterium]